MSLASAKLFNWWHAPFKTGSRSPPNAVVIGYGESSVDLSLRAWTGRSDQWVQTRSEILIEIGRRFAEAGIQIPFPQRDLHIIPADGAS